VTLFRSGKKLLPSRNDSEAKKKERKKTTKRSMFTLFSRVKTMAKKAIQRERKDW
jgi:hypothetical protein